MPSNCYRVYKTIYETLKKLSGVSGSSVRQLIVLAKLVCGILQSEEVKLADVTEHVPRAGQDESQIMQFRRWLSNEKVTAQLYYLPFIGQILRVLSSQQTIVLVIDGTTVGRGCMALMVSVLYQKRAIPLLWITRKCKKGHFPETLHIELINMVQALIPKGSDVVCLGDGEFDGAQWLNTLKGFGWSYVCRTSKDAVLYEEGEAFNLAEVCPLNGGEPVFIEGLEFTLKRNAIVNAVAWWSKEYAKPIFWVTNLGTAEEAYHWYRKRFQIETLFSDLKGRGFNIQKSGLRCPERISRLLIAVALSYIWTIYLGEYALQNGWQKIIHRSKRCDLSLFTLGLRFLSRVVSESLRLPPCCLTLGLTP